MTRTSRRAASNQLLLGRADRTRGTQNWDGCLISRLSMVHQFAAIELYDVYGFLRFLEMIPPIAFDERHDHVLVYDYDYCYGWYFVDDYDLPWQWVLMAMRLM